MARSLCAVSTVFHLIEVFFCLLALYYVLLAPSHHCVSVHHHAALKSCGADSDFNDTRTPLQVSLSTPSAGNDTVVWHSLLKDRLKPVESVICRELNVFKFSFTSGPKYMMFWLAYVCVLNILICLTLFVHRRADGVKFWEAAIIFATTAGSFVVVIVFQHIQHPTLFSVPAHLVGSATSSVPMNWLKANAIAIMTIVWKIVQFVFQHIKGESTIKVEKPMLKIFDFSKYYAAPTSAQ